MTECIETFNYLKNEYSERGVPFRWCWLDASETFDDGSVYIVKKTARKPGSQADSYPRERLYFNCLCVADKAELISYMAFNLAKNSGPLPDPIHARMVLGKSNVWSRMYFEWIKDNIHE